jgi:Tol biopolymer transport system component
MRSVLAPLIALALAAAYGQRGADRSSTPLALPQERHLRNVKQLTFEGENAEAYFSFDGSHLIFQSTAGHGCDQIYTMAIDGSDRRLVSTGKGRTTCSFYYPDGKSILYASTHLGGDACPAVPSRDQGYVWPIYDTYDIFRANTDGSNLRRLTTTAGYDAEATIAKDGRIVFTSVRDGDMDIYSMNGDGSDVRRLTNLPGPDGGPFFSPDGTKIVFRGRHPADGPELEEYFGLLKKGIWKPAGLDVFVMNRDGSGLRPVTKGLGGANWAPYWTPDGKRIIFASNMKDPRGGNFDIYLINVDGSGLEQVTFDPSFDGFPMFSPDGKKFVFASNRHDQTGTETNVFIADWQ